MTDEIDTNANIVMDAKPTDDATRPVPEAILERHAVMAAENLTTSPDVPEPVTLSDDEIMTQAQANAAAIAAEARQVERDAVKPEVPPVESAGRQIEPPIQTVDDRGRTI